MHPAGAHSGEQGLTRQQRLDNTINRDGVRSSSPIPCLFSPPVLIPGESDIPALLMGDTLALRLHIYDV